MRINKAIIFFIVFVAAAVFILGSGAARIEIPDNPAPLSEAVAVPRVGIIKKPISLRSGPLSMNGNPEGLAPISGVPATILTSTAAQGYVQAKYSYTGSAALKTLTQKSAASENFDFIGNGHEQAVPLSLGVGTYSVSILENVSGNSYRFVRSATAVLPAETLNTYLISIPGIRWTPGTSYTEMARVLTQNSVTDADAFKAIYEWVVKNVRYDYSKVGNLPNGYLPNPLTTYNTKKGICYDFASLLASMCRSQGIPTKLTKGYSTYVTGYHAWNEVYLDGQWKIVDTSTDSCYYQAGYSYTMYKSSGAYTATSSY
ncbi:MAG: transglutaminase-like domain-containing protein [Christensenellales bacterium]|jgi:transglutaminase-like putative cysteine protease